jgi:hypothetical protein
MLLADGLTDSLMILNDDRSLEVEMVLDPSLPYRFEMDLDGNRVRLRPSVASLGFWLGFGLKYFRDGRAETAVIDDRAFEAEFKPRRGSLHIRAQEYRSMTLEEAERRFCGPVKDDEVERRKLRLLEVLRQRAGLIQS